MAKPYDHLAIEKKWRERHRHQRWKNVDLKSAQDPYYVLDMFPYPSGHGIHVGHWRGYILSDYYARHALLHGKSVLHPMGFDSFGLPAENAAIKYKSHPKKFTDEAITAIRGQFEQMGTVFDWSKYLSTCEPEYYRWTQWLFLQFYKHGLAEKRLSPVNWCPNDQTVLANEQVVNGCCERCGATVTKKELAQWFIKTTHFAQELLDGLDDVDWPERIKALQRDWIGKSEGVVVVFDTEAGPLEVFTTRVDTIYGVTSLVLAPEHPLVEVLTTRAQKEAMADYIKAISAKTDIDRQQRWDQEKSAIDTGATATNPITGETIPIWVADYVLMNYGTGAVMSVPAHDERDWQFAQKYQLPIKQVVAEQFTQDVEPGIYRPDEPTVTQDGVIVLVKHWAEDKYLGLKWNEVAWGTLLTGGVEDGSTPEETVKREIIEETGYLDVVVARQLGVVDGLFYHVPKKTNKLVHGHIFVAELRSDKQQPISPEEQSKHELRWLTVDELTSFLTPATHQAAIKLLRHGLKPFSGTGSLVNSGEFTGLPSGEASDKIVKKLQELGSGDKKSTYRLRDWLVSRQRYWGPPIPIVYDPDGQPHPVKEEHLPLLLPDDVDFLPGGESPIARSQEYKERAERLYGEGWHFETDTLDTFVDSSWYFLRYLTPTDNSQAFDPELVKKWLPVDLYVGGVEHATMHLLYARAVTRFLATYGYIDRAMSEPFRGYYGIRHITLHGAKMSKSKGNVVSPDLLVQHFGTDALRGYELFIGPMDVEADWNNRGINGVHRFLIKLFQFTERIVDQPNQTVSSQFATYLRTINDMIDNFRLNTVIAEAMKFVNALPTEVPREIWQQFLVTLSPAFPYVAEELWESSGQTSSIFEASWPQATIDAPNAPITVLVNQKFVTRASLEGDEAAVTAAAQALPAVERALAGKKIRQTIFKPGQVVNFLAD